jgi:hypothetical protein
MTMNQPLGRVVALQFRNVAAQPGAHPTMPVLRVYIRTPMRTVEHHDLPNGNYVVQNPALQFLALHGYKPSDIDGTHMNIEADKVILPIAPMPADDSWGLAQDAMSGGEQALREAEWFDGGDIGDAEQTPQHGAGGSPDPGTGNRGGVEEPSDPEPKVGVADDDSDAGFEVTVE